MESNKKINVMMAENNHFGRDFFCAILEDEEGSRIKITGKAANGLELLELVEKNQPHIVILDLSMPVLDGKLKSVT